MFDFFSYCCQELEEELQSMLERTKVKEKDARYVLNNNIFKFIKINTLRLVITVIITYLSFLKVLKSKVLTFVMWLSFKSEKHGFGIAPIGLSFFFFFSFREIMY